jgi:hypothetical protein
MKTITQADFIAEVRRRHGDDPVKWKFVCPMCNTPQSAEDFYAAGFKRGTGEVNKYLGFSCIGRFTGKGPAKRASIVREGCDWTLGGLFQLHEVEIVTEDGKHCPHFDIAEAPTQPE